MEQAYVSLAASSIVRVCCDRFEDGDWSGRIYTRYQEEPTGFRNAGGLLGRLEAFYNWLGYPQAKRRANRRGKRRDNEQASG